MKKLPVFEIEDTLTELNDNPSLQRVTMFVGAKEIVRATRRFPPKKGDTRMEVIVTVGAPNFRERQVIARAKRDKMTPPEKLLAFFPKKGKR